MPKLTFLPDQMDDTWNNSSVTYRDIAKSSTLFPVVKALNAKYGFDKWGVDELGAYLQEHRLAKAKAGKVGNKRASTKKVNSAKLANQGDRTYQERMDAIMSPFDQESITPNDVQSFSTLVQIEIQMQDLDEMRKAAVTSGDATKMKVLSESYAKLSAEYRQIQSSLGIDRGSRETQVDTASELKKYQKGAEALIREQGILIRCQECQSKEVDINQGIILFHFRQDVPWKWESVCPKCGALIQSEGSVKQGEITEAIIEGDAQGAFGRIVAPTDPPPAERQSLSGGEE